MYDTISSLDMHTYPPSKSWRSAALGLTWSLKTDTLLNLNKIKNFVATLYLKDEKKTKPLNKQYANNKYFLIAFHQQWQNYNAVSHYSLPIFQVSSHFK